MTTQHAENVRHGKRGSIWFKTMKRHGKGREGIEFEKSFGQARQSETILSFCTQKTANFSSLHSSKYLKSLAVPIAPPNTDQFTQPSITNMTMSTPVKGIKFNPPSRLPWPSSLRTSRPIRRARYPPRMHHPEWRARHQRLDHQSTLHQTRRSHPNRNKSTRNATSTQDSAALSTISSSTSIQTVPHSLAMPLARFVVRRTSFGSMESPWIIC